MMAFYAIAFVGRPGCAYKRKQPANRTPSSAVCDEWEGLRMSDELTKNLFIVTQLESYQTIFRKEWAQQIDELATGTKLTPVVFALCASWKAAANTHILPWLVVNSLNQFWGNYIRHSGFTPEYLRVLPEGLMRRMGGVQMRNMQRQALTKAVNDLAAEVRQKIQDTPDPELSCESIWNNFIQIPDFQVSIWGSQQLVFGALFFAYENFVKDVVAIAKGEQEYEPLFGRLVDDAREQFGYDVVKNTLEGQFIDITRYARNCLAHRGGRESKKLKDTSHGIKVIDGILQITAADNNNCIRGLEKRAMILAEAATKMPQFKSPPATGPAGE
jgi:hypothetical protein